LAYGAVTGNDFASAIAAGNPVIAKAHPGHPGVSRLAAEEALAALSATGLPAATVQLLHGLSPADGERLVADRRVGATGFTGSQEVGRRLHRAAAATGRVIWLEMGSINPVVLLPGALAERADRLATELAASVTGSAGQLCTKPGLIFFIDDVGAKNSARVFVTALAAHLRAMGGQVLLGITGRDRLAAAVAGFQAAGARLHVGGEVGSGPCEYAATLLEATAADLLAAPEQLIREAFGNATLLVRCADGEELARVLEAVPGALVAGLHSTPNEADMASRFAAILVERAGRLVENRMTTGMTLSPAMQHGGPWPAASPPFFSAVGLPLSILRFARRVCYDGASQKILPEALRDAPPEGSPWRQFDGQWRRA
jgi:NADP-dependent aldehyde dehydrogenase